MKRSVIVGMICMFVVAGMSNLYAQQNRGQRGQRSEQCRKGMRCNLSDSQKEQMKEVRTKYAKQTLDIKNELNELQAKQQTLVSAEKPNQSQVYANIDKMTALKKELHLQKLDMRMEMRSFLTEEQLLRADARPNHRKGMKQGRGGKKGMAQGRMHGKRGHGQMQGKRGMGAQKGMQAGKGKRNMLDLSDDQQAKMKELRLAHMKDTKSLRDEAEELRLKQRNLMTDENPDKKVLIANVNRLADIQNTLAKKRYEHQMEVREILDEDQLVIFMSRAGKGKGFHRGHGKW
ncbi:Spy/CpxP family protein refolding chaperone [Marinifilum flexuosum]|uniref:Spy/CpxP family protein refolding chaperone n=1 Tax=Marinifilum flexuosum TaxID=1117708 RepID=UPI002490D57C|nr:periplasmic heavy metal sensor [Marinifilum flexuosum]